MALKNWKDIAELIGISAIVASLLFLGLAYGASANPTSNAWHITEAARSLISVLEEEQREKTLFSIEADDRASWSNLPVFMVQPGGLLIKNMSDEQRNALHALLRASMSSQGYGKAAGIIWLDDMLKEIDQRSFDEDPEAADDSFRKAMVATRDSGNYLSLIHI